MTKHRYSTIACVAVAALGYFVDTYDLLLFSILRTKSLTDLGVQGDALLSEGVFLLNMQMLGLLLGGILFGVWGDKRGRVSVLFASITLYSVATILNGFVESVGMYALLRFITGIGLAGELGAGITLVNETLPQKSRGYGVTIVATVGVSGVIAAALVGDLFPWRISYFIGGGLGLLLLLLRILVHESGMYEEVARQEVRRGDLTLLFADGERVRRYLCCILLGLPIWYIVGILVTFSPELGTALGLTEIPKASTAVIYNYTGFVIGDVASGLSSQWMRSRRRPIGIFLLLILVGLGLYFTSYGSSLSYFYSVCLLLGIGGGYWALFVTSASEQFGTNLRATVTTTVPNFVRGSVVPLTLGFRWLAETLGILNSALAVGILCLVIAALALARLKESFANDLNFTEVQRS